MKGKAFYLNNNVLGERIKELRENNGLKQSELSAILNISPSSISQYEAGERIPNDAIKIRIADLFNVSVDYLIGHEENNYLHKSLSEQQHYLLNIANSLNDSNLSKVIEYAELLSHKQNIIK